MAEIAHILLGTNLGDRAANLAAARDHIQALCHLLVASHVYETEAWGMEAQPAFYNQVLAVETSEDPLPFLNALLDVELLIGRTRNIKWEPRVIDIDLLFFGDICSEADELKLPHPLIPKRNFVLVPLLEVAPDLIHPTEHKTIEELYLACRDELDVIVLEDGV